MKRFDFTDRIVLDQHHEVRIVDTGCDLDHLNQMLNQVHFIDILNVYRLILIYFNFTVENNVGKILQMDFYKCPEFRGLLIQMAMVRF